MIKKNHQLFYFISFYFFLLAQSVDALFLVWFVHFIAHTVFVFIRFCLRFISTISFQCTKNVELTGCVGCSHSACIRPVIINSLGSSSFHDRGQTLRSIRAQCIRADGRRQPGHLELIIVNAQLGVKVAYDSCKSRVA